MARRHLSLLVIGLASCNAVLGLKASTLDQDAGQGSNAATSSIGSGSGVASSSSAGLADAGSASQTTGSASNGVSGSQTTGSAVATSGTPLGGSSSSASSSSACSDGAMDCNDGGVRTCTGGEWGAARECPDATPFCNGAGACGVCGNGQSQCDDGGVETCSNGSWGPPQLCRESACVSGACTGTCSPGTLQCTDTTQFEACDDTGNWGSSTPCPADAGDGGPVYCNGPGICGPAGSGSGTTCPGGFDAAASIDDAGGLNLGGAQGSYSSVGMGGYAFITGDWQRGGTSAGCMTEGALCVAGTTGAQGGATYGAGIGMNLNQPVNQGVMPYTPPGPGLSFAVSEIPPYGMNIVVNAPIDGGFISYFYQLRPGDPASGSVAWTAFGTTPYDPATNVPLDASPTLQSLVFQAVAGADSQPFEFCVTSVSFPLTLE